MPKYYYKFQEGSINSVVEGQAAFSINVQVTETTLEGYFQYNDLGADYQFSGEITDGGFVATEDLLEIFPDFPDIGIEPEPDVGKGLLYFITVDENGLPFVVIAWDGAVSEWLPPDEIPPDTPDVLAVTVFSDWDMNNIVYANWGYLLEDGDIQYNISLEVNVDIDIKPGSDPNSINLGSNGNVPVAILSSADFDATTVDPYTVTLAGAEVSLKGKAQTPMASVEDVNGDGLPGFSEPLGIYSGTLKLEDEQALTDVNLTLNNLPQGTAEISGSVTYSGSLLGTIHLYALGLTGTPFNHVSMPAGNRTRQLPRKEVKNQNLWLTIQVVPGEISRPVR